jgi:hypothetical protein
MKSGPHKRLRDGLTFPKKVTEEKYPYAEWFDGGIWKLSPGEDFNVDLMSFRSCLYMAAKRRKITVKTHIPKHKDCIFIQKVK